MCKQLITTRVVIVRRRPPVAVVVMTEVKTEVKRFSLNSELVDIVLKRGEVDGPNKTRTVTVQETGVHVSC